ncbi:MAG: hypothetical protein ACOY32_00335 [Thermodesulfobacteriota bacterium]
MTLRVGILGIDGSGKSTLVAGLEERLTPGRSLLIVGQRLTVYDRVGGRHDLLPPLPESAHPLRHLGRNLRRHWLLQRLPALIARHQPDICLEDRDTLIDPSALITAYLPVLRHVAPRRRVAILAGLSGRLPADLYLYLRLPAAEAEGRLQQKLQRTRRPRAWHESPLRLARMATEYARFLEYLGEEGIPVQVLDAAQPVDMVCDLACRSIVERFR